MAGNASFAPRPEAPALGFIARPADLGRARLPADLADPRQAGLDIRRRPVDFALRKDRRRVSGGIASVDMALGGVERQMVHHLQPGRNDARPDDLGDSVARVRHLRERRQQNLGVDRRRQQLDGDLGDHAQQPFRAGHQRQQVVTRRVERVAADLQHLAGHGHDLQPLDVGWTVRPYFQAMHAAERVP